MDSIQRFTYPVQLSQFQTRILQLSTVPVVLLLLKFDEENGAPGRRKATIKSPQFIKSKALIKYRLYWYHQSQVFLSKTCAYSVTRREVPGVCDNKG